MSYCEPHGIENCEECEEVARRELKAAQKKWEMASAEEKCEVLGHLALRGDEFCRRCRLDMRAGG